MCSTSALADALDAINGGLMGCCVSYDSRLCENSSSSVPQERLNEEKEPFNCSICLELVYKPVVQACGHIFCFWCAFQSMNRRKESYCPVCRRPYNVFPRVCELLHFALSKGVPKEYEQRGREIQCMEEQKELFSPRLLESPRQVWSSPNFDQASDLSSHELASRGLATPTVDASVGKSIPGPALGPQKESCHEDTLCETRDVSLQKGLTVDDFRCLDCNELLYRPVVLNCGEVFCEPCLRKTSFRVVSCPSCKAPHSGELILICLELHQYLECAFPAEYSKRKSQLPAETAAASQCENRPVEDCKAERLIHEGYGCDGCGMYPMEGPGYRCLKCTEKAGFHLCLSCHEVGGDVVGRFNQEHLSNHEMQLMQPRARHHLTFTFSNSTIQRRRQLQQTTSDLEDYINSFV